MSLFDTGIRPAIDEYLLAEAAKVKQYPNFNGTVAEYKKLHSWVGRHFNMLDYCELCGTKTAKRYDWAAIDNRYTKKREDWQYICRSCHIKSDGRINQLKKGLEGSKPYMLGKKHSPETRAKMRANHWSTKREWIPRERNEHGHFI